MLTQKAISKRSASRHASSPKLKTLNERIALIDERLELMGDRKDYAESKFLEAARAELENKLESEKLALKEKVIELVIEIEESDQA